MASYVITNIPQVLYTVTIDLPDLAAATAMAEVDLGLVLPHYSIMELEAWKVSPIGSAWIIAQDIVTNQGFINGILAPLLITANIAPAWYASLPAPDQAELDAYVLALVALKDGYAGAAVSMVVPVKPAFL